MNPPEWLNGEPDDLDGDHWDDLDPWEYEAVLWQPRPVEDVPTGGRL